MSICGNTMAVGLPTTAGMNTLTCNSSCGNSNLGPTDPLDKDQLGPRPNREKIREQIKDAIMLALGAPVLELEFDDQQLDFCIDRTLMIIEEYAGREYFSLYKFNTTPGQSVYEMPPDIGYIRQVYYKETGTFGFQASDLDGAIPIEYFYPGGAYASIQGGLIDPVQPIWGRMGEWTLYKQYEQMYSRVSSSLGGWEWLGGFKYIKIYPIPYRSQKVIVHYIQKNKDWGRITESMIQGAIIHAKEILARIRGKYQTIPGPSGGIQLDWQQLIQESREDRKEWLNDLIYRYGDVLPITMD